MDGSAHLALNRPDLADKIPRIRELMDRHVPDCLVEGYEDLIESLTLPDAGDRHVLAAAIKAQAQVIVTYNLKDFPDEIVEKVGSGGAASG